MPRLIELPLDFNGLAELDDGKVGKLLKFHLQRVVQDCMARPTDDAIRKVTLEFNVKPICDPSTGECDECRVEIEARSKVPTYRTKSYQMRATNSGLLFNKDDPTSPDQMSLLEEDEE